METPAAAAFWAPKAGNSLEEYEDAFALDVEKGRFAIADGASETSFAGQWARLLVSRFVADPPSASVPIAEWVQPLGEEWACHLKGRPLPWYAEVKAREGAFATLLGLSLDRESCRWWSLGIGDSCLVLVRRQKTIAAFPLSRAAQFNNRPRLISSHALANQAVWGDLRMEEGTIERGDLMFLMTDALAQWFLVEAELRRRPWAALRRLQSQEEFSHFLELLRAGQAIRNDDVTLLRVEAA